MNRLTLVLLLLGGVFPLLSQSFEGKIIYQNTYTSNISNATSEQLNAMMGTTQNYYIKEGKYKSILNGSFTQWQLYVPSTNRLYLKAAVSDTIMWSDGYTNSDEAVNYEIQKGQAEILGYNCDVLLVETKTGNAKYYFSDKVKVDPKLYKNHHYGNWALVLEQTKSLPLKIEMETPQFTLVSIAIEVKEMELEDSFFDLPVLPAIRIP